MDIIKINVYDIIGERLGINSEDGQLVYEKIAIAFEQDLNVSISFKNIDMLTTAFLNSAIGQLYRDFDEVFIKNHIQVTDLYDAGKVALKRVVDTAKFYFANPEAMQKSIDEILEH